MARQARPVDTAVAPPPSKKAVSSRASRTARRATRIAAKTLLLVSVVFFLPVGCMVIVHYAGDASGRAFTSRHESTGQAAIDEPDVAVIQVYAARAARWRGAFGVHTWVATRRSGATGWTRMDVIGYRVWYGGGAVRVRGGTPDGMWFGNYPVLLREVRGGAAVNAMIDRLEATAAAYPYDRVYHVWPGPNSNTFVASLGRAVPELQLELPPNAIGKDFLPNGRVFSRTPSGTGVQISFGGYAGVLVGVEEGVELNVLGLSAGIDLFPPALKLPGIGRIGFPDFKRFRIGGFDGETSLR